MMLNCMGDSPSFLHLRLVNRALVWVFFCSNKVGVSGYVYTLSRQKSDLWVSCLCSLSSSRILKQTRSVGFLLSKRTKFSGLLPPENDLVEVQWVYLSQKNCLILGSTIEYHNLCLSEDENNCSFKGFWVILFWRPGLGWLFSEEFVVSKEFDKVYLVGVRICRLYRVWHFVPWSKPRVMKLKFGMYPDL